MRECSGPRSIVRHEGHTTEDLKAGQLQFDVNVSLSAPPRRKNDSSLMGCSRSRGPAMEALLGGKASTQRPPALSCTDGRDG